MNEMRARLYAQLMEAQEQIAQMLYRRGVSESAIEAALDAADEALTVDERHEDLYLAALAHYVGALGGRLEVRAVVGDEAVVVRAEPAGEIR